MIGITNAVTINETHAFASVRSYTMDFGVSSELVQDVNIQGSVTINRIITKNVAALYLSYTGVIRQQIDLSSPEVSLNIPADEVLVWEIVRVNDDSLACVGIRYNLN